MAAAPEPGGTWVRTLRPDGSLRRWPLDIAQAPSASVRGGISLSDRIRLAIGRPEDLREESQATPRRSTLGLRLYVISNSLIAKGDHAGAPEVATRCTEVRPRYGSGWIMRVRARTALAASREETPGGLWRRGQDLDLAIADLGGGGAALRDELVRSRLR